MNNKMITTKEELLYRLRKNLEEVLLALDLSPNSVALQGRVEEIEQRIANVNSEFNNG